jgi:hypothetical protein
MNISTVPALLQNDDVIINRDHQRRDRAYAVLATLIVVAWFVAMAALASWGYRAAGVTGAAGVVLGIHALIAALFVAGAFRTLDEPGAAAARAAPVLAHERHTEAFASA